MEARDGMPEQFHLSSDIAYDVRVKIERVGGLLRSRPGCEALQTDPYFRHAQQTNQGLGLFVTAQVFADSKPLTIPTRTASQAQAGTGQQADVNQWLTLPITYRDLPVSAMLVLTVWDPYAPQQAVPIGGTSFPLFTNKRKKLKQGQHTLLLWPNVPGDGSHTSQTPHKVPRLESLFKVKKTIKRFERTQGSDADLLWLSEKTRRRLKEVLEAELLKADSMLLEIRLQQFELPVIFDAKKDEAVHATTMAAAAARSRLDIKWQMTDPEAEADNPVEWMHTAMTRSARNAEAHGEEPKPNAEMRNLLTRLINSPSTQALKEEHCNLLWRYRGYLTREKKALTKVLRSVQWNDSNEVAMVPDLFKRWVPIDVADALELLGPTFKDRTVRSYAANYVADNTDDEELLLYLLQLVQALKYEGVADSASLERSTLAARLIERSLASMEVGHFFYWYLRLEAQDKRSPLVFKLVERKLNSKLDPLRSEYLRRQQEMLDQLKKIHTRLIPLNRQKKIENLRRELARPENGLVSFAPMPLILDPTVIVVGIEPSTANVYKSAKQPMFLTFKRLDGGLYPVIFKCGDDVQQDQVVMQIFRLMERLLQKEKLDMHLTPYRVLPTAPDQGMLQFVAAEPLAKILEENNNDLQAYLRKFNADSGPNAIFGINSATMDTYVKSCAGYCVITYILGIGDRHLDNLLLKKEGNLLHIDFGFILGNDPKPFPPPMKLCPEMVQAMGGNGPDASLVQKFRSHCYVTYMTLRKSANLIIVLFSLMRDSNVSSISQDPDKAVGKVEDNFQLQRTDEEAMQHFRELITRSMNDILPQFMERMHRIAQYWRK